MLVGLTLSWGWSRHLQRSFPASVILQFCVRKQLLSNEDGRVVEKRGA